MTDSRVAPLLHVRQIRGFTKRAVTKADLAALADVARWTGSSQNTQPWRFIVIRDTKTLRKIAAAGMPQTRSLKSAMAAIAIVIPEEPKRAITHAYDEGRAAERILVAARMLGLGAAISWILAEGRDAVRALLDVPEGWRVRTVVAIGHPSAAARRPKSAAGKARLPRDDVVFDERWPKD